LLVVLPCVYVLSIGPVYCLLIATGDTEAGRTAELYPKVVDEMS
jgi:hypothetical protein